MTRRTLHLWCARLGAKERPVQGTVSVQFQDCLKKGRRPTRVVLASTWRPNQLVLKSLFSVNRVRKSFIFVAWGARGPGFKSRRPDQIPQRLTLTGLHNNHSLESNWSPKWT